MHILIVCPCWPGIEEAYNKGIEPNGMPGFFYVVRELISRGDNVDIFIYTSRDVHFFDNHMSKNHWFSKVKVLGVLKQNEYRKMHRIVYELLFPFKLNHELKKVVNKNKYDFIYGQGNYSDGARIIAKKKGIPFGLRKYGDDFAPLLRDKGIIKASIRSPAAALSYKTTKSFILATNDGTEIDKICKRVNHKIPYKIYLWNNGFEDQKRVDDKYSTLTNKPYIFSFSRIIRVKGQLDVINAFYEAKRKGFPGNYIIAGTADDKVYYNELCRKIKEYGLEDSVFFLGKITGEQTKYLTQHALANMISGVNYNINNVFIESMGYGGIVVVRDTPLVHNFIKHGYNGFVFSTTNDCSHIIMDLWHKKYDEKTLRMNAIADCNISFKPWKERATQEVELIHNIVNNT